MRGYRPTAVPADGYQTGVLALEAIGFHEALGGDGSGILIGHDWGAIAVHGAAVYCADKKRVERAQCRVEARMHRRTRLHGGS
jgi:hypothetical protein